VFVVHIAVDATTGAADHDLAGIDVVVDGEAALRECGCVRERAEQVVDARHFVEIVDPRLRHRDQIRNADAEIRRELLALRVQRDRDLGVRVRVRRPREEEEEYERTHLYSVAQ
jgi:hypothetical protein